MIADFEATREQILGIEEITRNMISLADSVGRLLAVGSGTVRLSTCDAVTLIRTPSVDSSAGELDALLASGSLGRIER
jgi:hypothetical protein